MTPLPARTSNYSPTLRPAESIRWIVLHCTQGSKGQFPHQATAQSVGRYFQSDLGKDPASTHVVCDDTEIVRCVPDEHAAYGAGVANPWSLHVEICGWAQWSFDQWTEHQASIYNAAMVAAAWSDKYDLPAQLVIPKSNLYHMGYQEKGITTHALITKYLANGNGHQDPGPNFPMASFLTTLEEILSGPREYLLDV